MKILLIGRGHAQTGYGRVMRQLHRGLADQGEVTHFAVDLFAWTDPPLEPGQIANSLIGDPFGLQQLPDLLETLRPDRLVLCHDAPIAGALMPVIKEYGAERPGFRFIPYVPVEWDHTRLHDLTWCAEADHVVAYTQFGQVRICEALDRQGLPHPPHSVVYHGVDTQTFFPIHDERSTGRRQARRSVFGDDRFADAFMVLNANRNAPRKRIDLTIVGFAEFAQTHPNAILVLHSHHARPAYDLLELAHDHGCADRLVLTQQLSIDRPWSDSQMNLLYNACDVGVNTSNGEGFGLVALEHAATGAAQIVPDHSACRELWCDHGVLIDISDRERGHVDPQHLSRILRELADQPSRLMALCDHARRRALDPQFSWQRFADRWRTVLEL